MKIIEVIADAQHLTAIKSIAAQKDALDCWSFAVSADELRCVTRMLVDDENRQAVLDALQGALGKSSDARIVVLPIEATLPRAEEKTSEDKSKSGNAGTSREELYQDISKNAVLDANFLLLVFLSTIVAAIGLIEDNVAVVIGAMVIAPLLGPNIALALSTALGDTELMWRALKANLAGLGLAFVLSLIIGLVWPQNMQSPELLARTVVGLDSVALALASGAAAVLSLTTGLSSVLVGVMVAVALLPPTATVGLMLGSGQINLALGALLLLGVNVVCVNLAAKVVFLIRGIHPRTWLEKQKARQSMTAYIIFWVISLLILLVAIYFRTPFFGNR